MRTVEKHLFSTPSEGLNAEIELLDKVAQGHIDFGAFTWQSIANGLVVPEPFGRRDEFQTASKNSANLGWPVSLRRTGGGGTPQGPGVLNLAIAFRSNEAKGLTVEKAYDAICSPIAKTFEEIGLSSDTTAVDGSFCDGAYNLAIGGQKIVGTAQRWKRCKTSKTDSAVLCHALILTDIVIDPPVRALNRFFSELGVQGKFTNRAHVSLTKLKGHDFSLQVFEQTLLKNAQAKPELCLSTVE